MNGGWLVHRSPRSENEAVIWAGTEPGRGHNQGHSPSDVLAPHFTGANPDVARVRFGEARLTV